MATAYLSPGVYVEEVDRGSKPIEGVGTAVAAFVGFAEEGPVGYPTLVTNWSQFTNTFGGFVRGGYLASAVYAYFNNGGGTCYVTRLPGEIKNGHTANGTPKALPAATAALPSRSGAAASLEFTAVEATAAASGEVSVEIRAAEEGQPEESFTVVVKRGDAEEIIPNVTLGKGRNARNVIETVNRESKLVRVAEREATGSLVERAPARRGRASGPDRAHEPLRSDERPRGDSGLPARHEPAADPRVAHEHRGLRLEICRAVLPVGPRRRSARRVR
jgi:phage tail sheath protein FI